MRLSIIALLSGSGPLPTKTLKEKAPVSRQAIRKHLGVLEKAGLVSSERVGRDRSWRIEAAPMAKAREHLEQVSAQWDRRLERLRALVEKDSGQLRTVPPPAKKLA